MAGKPGDERVGFRVVAHADWGSTPDKRRLALAHLRADGRYLLERIEPDREPEKLLAAVREAAGAGRPALLGFDFPIGLPIAYAKLAGIERFLDALPGFGMNEWADFYRPAETPDQIHLHRPFYPLRPGGARYAHLLDALNVCSMDNLRRRCELAYPGRRAAAPLFWTLGGQQVGKAAIHGWRDVLAPALRDSRRPVFLWPFDGNLEEGRRSGKIVAAECYPGEYYRALGVQWGTRGRGTRSGKRSAVDRRANASVLEAACAKVGLELSTEVLAQVRSGFGERPDGEDPFDALVGLLGMMFVVRGYLMEGYPQEEEIREVEGWILGQETG